MVSIIDVEKYARTALCLRPGVKLSVFYYDDLYYGAKVFEVVYGDTSKSATFICGTITEMNETAAMAIKIDYAKRINPKLVAEYADLDSKEGYELLTTLYRSLRESPMLTPSVLRLVTNRDDFVTAAIEEHGRAYFLASDLIEHRFGKHYMYRVEM